MARSRRMVFSPDQMAFSFVTGTVVEHVVAAPAGDPGAVQLSRLTAGAHALNDDPGAPLCLVDETTLKLVHGFLHDKVGAAEVPVEILERLLALKDQYHAATGLRPSLDPFERIGQLRKQLSFRQGFTNLIRAVAGLAPIEYGRA